MKIIILKNDHRTIGRLHTSNLIFFKAGWGLGTGTAAFPIQRVLLQIFCILNGPLDCKIVAKILLFKIQLVHEVFPS